MLSGHVTPERPDCVHRPVLARSRRLSSLEALPSQDRFVEPLVTRGAAPMILSEQDRAKRKEYVIADKPTGGHQTPCGLGESFTIAADSLAMTVGALGSGSRVPEALREVEAGSSYVKQKRGLSNP